MTLAVDPDVFDARLRRHRYRPRRQLIRCSEGVLGSGNEQRRHFDRGQMLNSQPIRLAGRMQWIADQHKPAKIVWGRLLINSGRNHRTHPSTHRATADHQGFVVGQQRQFLTNRRQEHRGPIRGLATLLSVREVCSHAADRSDSFFDGDQRRLRRTRTGTRIEQQRGHDTLPVSTRRASLRSRIALLAFTLLPPWSG